jgi:hypothetical protein
MRGRIVGVLAMIAGIVGVGLSIYGAVVTPRTADLALAARCPGGVPRFDLADWKVHWWTWSIAIAAACASTAFGGLSLYRGRPFGYLYIVFGAAAPAAFPRVLGHFGRKLYVLERPGNPDTVFLASVAVSIAVAFFWIWRRDTYIRLECCRTCLLQSRR